MPLPSRLMNMEHENEQDVNGDVSEQVATAPRALPSDSLTQREKDAEFWTRIHDEYMDEHDDDLTCPACGGSGADAWEGFMPCEECDGEGYRWWE